METERLDNSAVEQAANLTQVLKLLENPETLQALATIVQHLPQLAEMTTKLSEAYGTVKSLATDPVFIADMKGGFEEVVLPVTDRVKGLASAVIEANDMAKESDTPIGIFGVMKMLKDPQAQKLLHFIQAFMTVLNKQEKTR